MQVGSEATEDVLEDDSEAVEDAEFAGSCTVIGAEDAADTKPRISARICVYPSTKERLVVVTCCLISLMRTQLLTEVMMEARAADTSDAMMDLPESYRYYHYYNCRYYIR